MYPLSQGASMEPGFLKPGNLEYAKGTGALREASMEPGFLKPGNLRGFEFLVNRCISLQWSQAS